MRNRHDVIISDLQEMLNNPETNPERLANVLDILQSFGEIRIAIEFKCAACCKTVSNGRFIIPVTIGDEVLIILFPGGFEELCLKEACSGKIVRKEIEFIVIPYEMISSFEFYEVSCYAPIDCKGAK